MVLIATHVLKINNNTILQEHPKNALHLVHFHMLHNTTIMLLLIIQITTYIIVWCPFPTLYFFHIYPEWLIIITIGSSLITVGIHSAGCLLFVAVAQTGVVFDNFRRASHAKKLQIMTPQARLRTNTKIEE